MINIGYVFNPKIFASYKKIGLQNYDWLSLKKLAINKSALQLFEAVNYIQ